MPLESVRHPRRIPAAFRNQRLNLFGLKIDNDIDIQGRSWNAMRGTRNGAAYLVWNLHPIKHCEQMREGVSEPAHRD